MKRKFKLTIIAENDCETLKEGLDKAREDFKLFSVEDVKPVISLRTLQQNRSLHKFCELLAQELEEKHIDKREFFKEPFFVSWTTEGVKNDVWRPLMKSITGKKSTTKLDKTQEINLIVDNIRRIITEKYKGEVEVPNFPSYENDDRGF